MSLLIRAQAPAASSPRPIPKRKGPPTSKKTTPTPNTGSISLRTSRKSKAANDYDTLWNACEHAAREAGFTIDRFEYRTGLLTTKPLVSRQFFEVWKQDVVDFRGQIDSDAATRRRVVRFQIEKLADDRYQVVEPQGGGRAFLDA